MNIHTRAKEIVKRRNRIDFELTEILVELDETEAYKELEHPSLFVYAMKELELTRDVARYFIHVARKTVEFPELREAIELEKVTVSKCVKVAAKLTKENVVEVIEYLGKKSVEKTLEWLGQNEEHKMNLKLALRIVDKLRHAQSHTRENLDLEATVELVVDEYNNRRDPVAKADRAEKRKAAKRETSRTQQSKQKKRQYPAALRHALNKRDRRQCRHHDSDRERCAYKKYVDFHHIIEVSDGGPDALENMITLCTAHHKMVHENQIPRSVQIEWRDM